MTFCLGAEHAWSKLGSTATGITGFGSERPDWLYGFSLYEASAVLGGLAFAAIYLAFAYLTFIYQMAGLATGRCASAFERFR